MSNRDTIWKGGKFLSVTLDIDVEDLDGTDVWRKTYERTRCEQVTDPNNLKEMSVISS